VKALRWLNKKSSDPLFTDNLTTGTSQTLAFERTNGRI
jgi:hypothetical protein